jgi:hypothetical protein
LGGYSASAAPASFLIGASKPVIVSIVVDPGPGAAEEMQNAGCVIHKLNYDNAGKYVGERQIPHC